MLLHRLFRHARQSKIKIPIPSDSVRIAMGSTFLIVISEVKQTTWSHVRCRNAALVPIIISANINGHRIVDCLKLQLTMHAPNMGIIHDVGINTSGLYSLAVQNALCSERNMLCKPGIHFPHARMQIEICHLP